MDIHNAFRIGAQTIARSEKEYTQLHKAHGIEQSDWELLTQREYWTPEQSQKIRSILANVVEVSMTIAGMPAIPLPAHYVAAVISEVVAPINQMVACVKAPDTFDAVDASGLLGTHVVKDMPVQQLMSIVLAYNGGFPGEPAPHRLPKQTRDRIRKEQAAK